MYLDTNIRDKTKNPFELSLNRLDVKKIPFNMMTYHKSIMVFSSLDTI